MTTPAASDSTSDARLSLKRAARERLTQAHPHLVDLSHRIHAHPELGFAEERASAWLTETLSDAGFAVEKGICDLPTAFRARVGSGPLHVAICAEYDALPAIGHACGHNLIAAMAVGAGMAAAQVADEAGLTVEVIGTPAEEGGGGKILLLERGAFDGVHAAMMVHPSPRDQLTPAIIAATHFQVTYIGKEAHAAHSPHQGINAADALTIAQVAIGLLRQHIRASDRIHGITTHGGDAPNVVPARTTANYICRSATLEALRDLTPRVRNCFEAGALATGAQVQIDEDPRPYAEMVYDPILSASYQRNAEELGRTFTHSPSAASTDMGNISLAIPSIQPTIGVDSLPFAPHQREFAAACVTPAADQAVHDGALAMAWTILDIATDDAARDSFIARGGYQRG